MPFTASEGDTIKLDDDSTQPPYDSEFTMGPLGTNTELSNITDIQSTYHGTAALDSSGNVWFWGGANTSMQYAYPTKLLDSSSIPGIVGMATNGKSIIRVEIGRNLLYSRCWYLRSTRKWCVVRSIYVLANRYDVTRKNDKKGIWW